MPIRLLVSIVLFLANSSAAEVDEETEELEEIELDSRDNTHKDMAPEDEEVE